MAAADAAGLCDPAHLHLFAMWYAFGGLQRGLSPLELQAMPQTLVKDFLYLLKRVGRLRERERVRAAS